MKEKITFQPDKDNPELWVTSVTGIQADKPKVNDDGETKPGNGKNQRRKKRGGQRDH